MIRLLTLFVLAHTILSLQFSEEDTLTQKLNKIVIDRNLSGLQIGITRKAQTIYEHAFGIKNTRNQSIDSTTMFTVASLSKSLNGVAIMQLVQKGLLNLNDTLTKYLQFEVKNPHFPDIPITIQMVLCHKSSIQQTWDEYSQFIWDTQNSIDGKSIPSLKQILTPSGKYFNPQIFPQNKKPGDYFRYSNLGFVIAGTIIEKITGKRFDVYQKQNILDLISQGEMQNATFNPATIKDFNNLGTIFEGKNGIWVPSRDNYTSSIQQKNLTFYKIGTNAGIYGPADSLRGSMRHMNNYIFMIGNKGVTKQGKRVFAESSVNQLIKLRYQYHGNSFGNIAIFHSYGLGIYASTHSKIDIVIPHQVVRGHLGNAYGLISAYFYWNDYTFSYIFNGAMNGYEKNGNNLYEVQRFMVHDAVSEFIQSYKYRKNMSELTVVKGNTTFRNQQSVTVQA